MKKFDELIRTLEPGYYTDPEILIRERNGLLATTWQFAGHVSQIKNEGDYFTFKIAGENLFCIRGKKGEIQAFYNVCQHRGHELLSESGNRRMIVCPYHSWTYELDGRLRNGPNIDSVPGFDKSKICLQSVAVEIFHGFIFVNLNRDAEPMDTWFPNVREELLLFAPDIHQLQPLDWIVVTERCNWKISIENYSECYHCRINHKAFATGVVKPETYNIMPQGYCLRHTTECQNLDRMSYPVNIDANDKAGEYSSWFLWPMFSFQVYPGNILNTYHWREIDTDEVEVWRGWYSVDGEDSSIIEELAKQDRETTFEEDIQLVESVQRGVRSRGYRPGPLVIDPNYGVNSEHSVSVLQNWFREGLDDESNPSSS